MLVFSAPSGSQSNIHKQVLNVLIDEYIDLFHLVRKIIVLQQQQIE